MKYAVLPFFASFLAAAVFTPAVIYFSRKLGFVAKPREDRWHTKPTALLGGIAIFASTALVWAFLPDRSAILPFAGPAAFIFILGVVDDRLTLRPHVKLIGQLTAAGIAILSGVRFGILHPVLAIPLTLFWLVAITNAVNLLDNMDGLASGVSAISALILAGYLAMKENYALAPVAVALAGACLGFLIYNFNPAKIFMGDCGSMFIGFTLAALAVDGVHRSAPNLMLSLLMPVVVLAIPIFDTTLVSVARTLHGRSISQGGRDHSSHRLFALGLSERGTMLVMCLMTALFGALALLSTQVHLLVVALLAALLFSGLLILGMYLGVLRVYSEPASVPENIRRLGGEVLFKKQMLQVAIDVVFICCAFVGANVLRFDGSVPGLISAKMAAALPFAIIAKLTGLAVCRAYRGVWRYAGISDAVTAAAGSTVGSILLAVGLGIATHYRDLSRSSLIIDWLLFTLLAIGGRTWYMFLRHIFAMLPARSDERVVILGAAPEAIALAHKLRDPLADKRVQVLGILDDDPGKHGRTLNGVTVLGPISDLPALVQQRGVSYCLLGVPPESGAGGDILTFCREQEIKVVAAIETPRISAEPLGLAAVHN